MEDDVEVDGTSQWEWTGLLEKSDFLRGLSWGVSCLRTDCRENQDGWAVQAIAATHTAPRRPLTSTHFDTNTHLDINPQTQQQQQQQRNGQQDSKAIRVTSEEINADEPVREIAQNPSRERPGDGTGGSPPFVENADQTNRSFERGKDLDVSVFIAGRVLPEPEIENLPPLNMTGNSSLPSALEVLQGVRRSGSGCTGEGNEEEQKEDCVSANTFPGEECNREQNISREGLANICREGPNARQGSDPEAYANILPSTTTLTHQKPPVVRSHGSEGETLVTKGRDMSRPRGSFDGRKDRENCKNCKNCKNCEDFDECEDCEDCSDRDDCSDCGVCDECGGCVKVNSEGKECQRKKVRDEFCLSWSHELLCANKQVVPDTKALVSPRLGHGGRQPRSDRPLSKVAIPTASLKSSPSPELLPQSFVATVSTLKSAPAVVTVSRSTWQRLSKGRDGKSPIDSKASLLSKPAQGAVMSRRKGRGTGKGSRGELLLSAVSFAVLDGHGTGGRQAAAAIEESFVRKFSNHVASTTVLPTARPIALPGGQRLCGEREACEMLGVVRSALEEAQETVVRLNIEAQKDFGSTCVTITLVNDLLITSACGDSTALLISFQPKHGSAVPPVHPPGNSQHHQVPSSGSGSGSCLGLALGTTPAAAVDSLQGPPWIIELSRRHHLDDKEEAGRIAALGEGRVIIGDGGVLRLIPGNLDYEESKRRGLSINMSRSVGHAIFKGLGLSTQNDYSILSLRQIPQLVHATAHESSRAFRCLRLPALTSAQCRDTLLSLQRRKERKAIRSAHRLRHTSSCTDPVVCASPSMCAECGKRDHPGDHSGGRSGEHSGDRTGHGARVGRCNTHTEHSASDWPLTGRPHAAHKRSPQDPLSSGRPRKLIDAHESNAHQSNAPESNARESNAHVEKGKHISKHSGRHSGIQKDEGEYTKIGRRWSNVDDNKYSSAQAGSAGSATSVSASLAASAAGSAAASATASASNTGRRRPRQLLKSIVRKLSHNKPEGVFLGESFLLLMSDGITDVLSSSCIVDLLRQHHLINSKEGRPFDPEAFSNSLAFIARDRRLRANQRADNCTCLTVHLLPKLPHHAN